MTLVYRPSELPFASPDTGSAQPPEDASRIAQHDTMTGTAALCGLDQLDPAQPAQRLAADGPGAGVSAGQPLLSLLPLDRQAAQAVPAPARLQRERATPVGAAGRYLATMLLRAEQRDDESSPHRPGDTAGPSALHPPTAVFRMNGVVTPPCAPSTPLAPPWRRIPRRPQLPPRLPAQAIPRARTSKPSDHGDDPHRPHRRVAGREGIAGHAAGDNSSARLTSTTRACWDNTRSVPPKRRTAAEAIRMARLAALHLPASILRKNTRPRLRPDR